METEKVQLKEVFDNVISKNPSRDIEKVFVDHLSNNEGGINTIKTRNFFFTDFSKPFLSYIARCITHTSSEEISGHYCIWISQKGKTDDKPYYRVRRFIGKNKCSLRSYVSCMTVRYFRKEAKKEQVRMDNLDSIDEQNLINKNDEVENPFFKMLLEVHIDPEVDVSTKVSLKELINELPEKERLVLEKTFFDGKSGIEVYTELSDYYPEELRNQPRQKKQTEVAKTKAKAIKLLQKICQEKSINSPLQIDIE